MKKVLVVLLVASSMMSCNNIFNVETDEDIIDNNSNYSVEEISDCKKVHDKMVACNIYSEGAYHCEEFAGEEMACMADCFSKNQCDEMRTFVCDDYVTDSVLSNCLDRCQGKQFICETGGESISDGWVCDGEEDCMDGSDETGCSVEVYVCDDGEEISYDWACDGEEDCWNGDDEEGCESVEQYTCDDGEEIPSDWVCDGEEDCWGGDDEEGCRGAEQFTCDDGEEIPSNWQCDGEFDCLDLSDESNCAQFVCEY